MPDGPVSAVAWSTAAAMIGSDQSSACKVSTYNLEIAAGGALSLPIRNPITDGWFRSRRASLAIEAAATFSSAASHGSPPVLAARFPFVAALPAGEDHDAVTVGEIVEACVLQLALTANGVEPEVHGRN